MAGPNPSKKLPIIVVDPDSRIIDYVEGFLREPVDYRHAHFELVKADTPEEAAQQISKINIPKNAAIIYESSAMIGKIKHVAKVHQQDPYMPQIAITVKGVQRKESSAQTIDEVLWQANRAGVRYHIAGFPSYSSSSGTIETANFKFNELMNHLFKFASPFSRGKVIKIGGSAFDYDRQVKNDPALGEYCGILRGLLEQRVPHPDKPRSRKWEMKAHKVICTVGAGQLGDVVKDSKAKYEPFGHSDIVPAPMDELPKIFRGESFCDTFGLVGAEEITKLAHLYLTYLELGYPEFIALALDLNLRMVHTLLGPKHASLINTGGFYFISNHNYHKIPLIGIAPHYIMVRDEIPLQDSDTHTIALAEFFGIDTVILLKRTDGIYQFDPMRGCNLDPITGNCKDYDLWKAAQRGNKRFDLVSVESMLSGSLFSREGSNIHGDADGTKGHLMEDSALEYMLNCKHVKQILVVPIAPHELYVPGENGSHEHIVTGEKMKAASLYAMRKGLLEAALNGHSQSRIVRTI